jgi:hypothetical protein
MNGKTKIRSMFEKRLLLKPKNLNIWYAYLFFEIKNRLFKNAMKLLFRILSKSTPSKNFSSLNFFCGKILLTLNICLKLKKFKKKLRLGALKKKIWKSFFKKPMIHLLIFSIQIELIFGKPENILLFFHVIQVNKTLNNSRLLKILKYIHEMLRERKKEIFLLKDFLVEFFHTNQRKSFYFLNFFLLLKVIRNKYLNSKFLVKFGPFEKLIFRESKKNTIFYQFFINFLNLSTTYFFYSLSKIFLSFFFREKVERYDKVDKKKNIFAFEILLDFLYFTIFSDSNKALIKREYVHNSITFMIFKLIRKNNCFLSPKKVEKRNIKYKARILKFFCFF